MILIAIQAIRIGLALARGEGDLGTGPVWQPREVLGKRIGMVVITAAFVATLPWLGLTLGTFLALAAGLYLMGIRNRKVLIVLPAIIAATLYLLFVAVLDSAQVGRQWLATGLARGAGVVFNRGLALGLL